MSRVHRPIRSAGDNDIVVDDTTALLNWLSAQVFPKNIPRDLTIPSQVSQLIHRTPDSRIFLPVFQRLLYSHSNEFETYYNNDLILFFHWIDKATSHMNLIYMFFQLDRKDVTLLKRSEFAIYKGFIDNIIEDIKQHFALSSDYSELYQISKTLIKISLADTLDDLIFDVSVSKINNKISAIYVDTPILAEIEEWVTDDLYLSLHSCVSKRNSEGFKDTLLDIAKTTLISRRTQHIFDIVDAYPDSINTLREFHNCLNKDIRKNILVKDFVNGLHSKLLLPSINTTNIILYYIKTIHSFLIIDHRGVLLDKVARPIRRYLCQRDDTVERIVNGLLNTDKSSNKLIELNNELYKDHADSKDPNYFLRQQRRTLNWVPDPVDALPDFQIGKIDDLIESLTSIFDDNNMFIIQFVKIFAMDILSVTNYDITNIVRNLNLLKSKFVDNDFNKIDVMINDMLQSRKLDHQITQNHALQPLEPFSVNGLFLSRLFWPNLSSVSSTFLFEKRIQDAIANYEQSYKNLQKGRSLKLHPQYTNISIDIERRNAITNYNVTLEKYSVLSLIQELNIPNVKIGIIMMKLKMPLNLIKASLEYWVKENVLIELNGGWQINE